MTFNYHKEQDTCQSRTHATLSEAVSDHASKVGFPIKLDAQFEAVTETEREKLDEQVFPDNLFTSNVNLAHSKKAFLNIVRGLDDVSKIEQLWSMDTPWLQPQTIAGDIDSAFTSYDVTPTSLVDKSEEKLTEGEIEGRHPYTD